MANKRGRKSKLDVVKENLEQIKEWAETGVNEEQMAKSLGISVSTWEKYKNEFSELKEILKGGRIKLVADLKSALIKRALGFSYEEKKQYIKEDDTGGTTTYTEITTKKALPDVAALNSALQNFDGDWYRDKKNYEIKLQELKLRERLAEKDNW